MTDKPRLKDSCSAQMVPHFYTASSITEIKQGYLHRRTTWYLGWTLDVQWPTAAMFRRNKKQKTRGAGQQRGQVGDKIHLRWRGQDRRVTETLRKVILLWRGAARLNVSSARDSEDGSWIKHEVERPERLSQGGPSRETSTPKWTWHRTQATNWIRQHDIKFHWRLRPL